MISIDEDWSNDPLVFSCYYSIHSDSWKIRDWCGENFGGYYMSDDYGERWEWQATGHYGGDDGSMSITFKYEEDATAFKLRWA